MIAALIRWSIVNRMLVLLATVGVTAWGVWSLARTPLDALPDLSDVQVIIRTPYPGQAPRITPRGWRASSAARRRWWASTGSRLRKPRR